MLERSGITYVLWNKFEPCDFQLLDALVYEKILH